MSESLGKLRRVSRNAAVASVSLAAVAASALYLAAPSANALAATARAAGSSGDDSIVVYGKVTGPNGKAAAHARVVVSQSAHGHAKVEKVATTSAKGTYRLVADLPSSTYRLTISEKVGKRVVSGSTKVHLVAGTSYNVSGKIVKKSVFNLLPISTY